jgi:DNA-binding SARP family transcriptional activator
MLIFESLAPAPEGFKLKTRNSWLATGTIEDMEARGEATAPPAPTLLPIGATSPDSEALIELEASGVLTLEGPEEETLDLLRALALSAASSPWSQRTQVVLVGIGGEMTELPWVSQASLEGALDRAEAHVGQVSAALEPLGCETTTQARARVPQSEAWDPLVIVSAVRPDDAGIRLRLRELIAQPRRGVSVVTLAPRNAVLPARSLVIEDDGSMRADGIDQVVWPRLLDEANSEGMVQLLGQAGQLGDEAFTLASSSTTGDGPPDDSPPDSGPAPADSSPAAAPVEPSGPSRLGLEVVLDDVEVLVRVLGEVVAVRRPGLPSEEKLIPSRHKVLETATYLAARQQPVAAGELERSLFPNDRDPAARVTASVDAARSLLGDDLVLGPTDGAYEVSDRVTTDYGLFAELTAQADETDDAHRAAWLLTEALDLVRGEPFTGVGQGYAWVAAHREVIISEVVDAAEELAEVRLALGDWRSAEWAARQGLRAFPTDERLYRLLMRVAQAAGRGTSGVRDLVDQLQEAMRDPKRGVAGEDSLHPETIELMQELTGAGLEPAGADAWQEA